MCTGDLRLTKLPTDVSANVQEKSRYTAAEVATHNTSHSFSTVLETTRFTFVFRNEIKVSDSRSAG